MREISEEREKELDKTCPIAYQAIMSDQCEKLKRFIREHDDYIEYALVYGGLVEVAVVNDKVKALKVFLDAGVQPDCIVPGLNQTLLWHAIHRRAYNCYISS